MVRSLSRNQSDPVQSMCKTMLAAQCSADDQASNVMHTGSSVCATLIDEDEASMQSFYKRLRHAPCLLLRHCSSEGAQLFMRSSRCRIHPGNFLTRHGSISLAPIERVPTRIRTQHISNPSTCIQQTQQWRLQWCYRPSREEL